MPTYWNCSFVTENQTVYYSLTFMSNKTFWTEKIVAKPHFSQKKIRCRYKMIDNRVNFYNVQMRNTTKLIKVHTCYY